MSEASEPTDDRVDVLLLYVYSDDTHQHFANVTDLANDGDSLPPLEDESGKRSDLMMSFDGAIVTPKPRPGQMFKFKMQGKTIFYDKKRTAPERFVGRWKNDSDVAQWRAREEAWDRHREAKKALAKDAASKYHLDALDDLRQAYRTLPSFAKAQLLAIIVRYITA